ncbi:MAG: glutathione peroxidase [Luteibaculaceae bacterium]
MSNFFDFKIKTINGDLLDFSKLKGNKILVVNTASECGLTPQYAQLQELYENYKSQGLQILAFPCNDFGGQEPGSAETIKEFCTLNYGVTFPIMEKVAVKGSKIHPVYAWLTQKETNGVENVEITWNFQKFLINPDGTYKAFLPPTESPFSETILQWLNQK